MKGLLRRLSRGDRVGPVEHESMDDDGEGEVLRLLRGLSSQIEDLGDRLGSLEDDMRSDSHRTGLPRLPGTNADGPDLFQDGISSRAANGAAASLGPPPSATAGGIQRFAGDGPAGTDGKQEGVASSMIKSLNVARSSSQRHERDSITDSGEAVPSGGGGGDGSGGGGAAPNKSKSKKKARKQRALARQAFQKDLESACNVYKYNEDRPRKVDFLGKTSLIVLPETQWLRFWSLLILLITVYYIAWIPLSIAFDLSAEGGLLMAHGVFDALYLIDIVITFRTAYLNKWGDLVIDVNMIAMRYLKSWFLLDLIAAVPFSWFDQKEMATYNKILRFRLFKLPRILKVFEKARALQRIVGNQAFRVGKSFVMLVFTQHFVACIYWMVAMGYYGQINKNHVGPCAHMKEINVTAEEADAIYSCFNRECIWEGNCPPGTHADVPGWGGAVYQIPDNWVPPPHMVRSFVCSSVRSLPSFALAQRRTCRCLCCRRPPPARWCLCLLFSSSFVGTLPWLASDDARCFRSGPLCLPACLLASFVFVVSFSSSSWQANVTQLEQFLYSYFWAVVVTTGVGYDVVPSNGGQVMFTWLMILFGLIFYSYVLGSVGAVLEEINEENSKRQQVLDRVSGYMKTQRVPSFFHKVILDFFQHNMESTRTKEAEEEVMSELPHTLRVRLMLLNNKQLMQRIRVLEDMRAEIFINLIQLLKPLMFLPGEFITQAATEIEAVMFIDRGRVDIIQHGVDNEEDTNMDRVRLPYSRKCSSARLQGCLAARLHSCLPACMHLCLVLSLTKRKHIVCCPFTP